MYKCIGSSWILQQESVFQVLPEYDTTEPLLCVLPFLNIELQI